ncbi:hypothetical protein [Kitasatospora indigofera]|uniref:hypothetical protein n=1 Tax=Kitasatospora indigofera TaxID=67307 RepID=UPI0033B2A005
MSRYTMPLTKTLNLQFGYDRPLHNVFAQLWNNSSDGEPVQALGLDPFITTVNTLMPAIDAMLAPHPGAALSDADRDVIRKRLVADGADRGSVI